MRLKAVFSAIGSKATIATLVVLGLLSIPVECSVAMGPHTIFVSADAVAALQDDARQPHAAHSAHAAPRHTDTTSAPASTSHQPHGVSPTYQPASNPAVAGQVPANAASPDDAAATPRGLNAPARPAGISADAVVALDIPGGQPDLLGPAHEGRIRFAFTMPPDRLLTGPEPPPP